MPVNPRTDPSRIGFLPVKTGEKSIFPRAQNPTMNYSMDRPLEKSFSSRHRTLLVTFATLAIAIPLALWLRDSLATNAIRLDKDEVRIGTTARATLHDYLALRVTVVPRDIVYVDASDGGRVEQVFIKPGDLVKSGQSLIAMSNTQLELQVLEQEGRLIESLTQLNNYQALLEQTRLNNETALNDIDFNITRLNRAFARTSPLAAAGVISQESLDVIQDELESYKRRRVVQAASNRKHMDLMQAQLPQIREQMSTLQQNLKITRSKLDNLTIRAPNAARVTSVDLKIGQNVRPGDRLAQLTLDTGFLLTQDVDEFYLHRLHNEQSGTVDVGAQQWPVKIARLYPQIKNGTFTVDFEFVGKSPPDLLPGQTIQGKLSLGDDTEALIAPTGPYLERTGGKWVFVMSPDGSSARRKDITTGRRNSEQIEILSGLAAGDRILISDYAGLDKIDRVDLQ